MKDKIKTIEIDRVEFPFNVYNVQGNVGDKKKDRDIRTMV